MSVSTRKIRWANSIRFKGFLHLNPLVEYLAENFAIAFDYYHLPSLMMPCLPFRGEDLRLLNIIYRRFLSIDYSHLNRSESIRGEKRRDGCSLTFRIQIHTPWHVHVRIMKIFQMPMHLKMYEKNFFSLSFSNESAAWLCSTNNRRAILSVQSAVVPPVPPKLRDIVRDVVGGPLYQRIKEQTGCEILIWHEPIYLWNLQSAFFGSILSASFNNVNALSEWLHLCCA